MLRRTALGAAAASAAYMAFSKGGIGVARAAPELPRSANPGEVGFAPDRLGRITTWLRAEVAEGTIPGAVVIVGRRGKVALLEAVGFRDRASNAPMPLDAVFPIASLSKPIVSLAAMILMEEGRLQLIHPISRYLPEMRELRVAVPRNGTDGTGEVVLEAPRREPTIQDLLRHTAGFTYGPFGDSAVKRLYRDARVDRPDQTIEEFVTGLSRLPLASQPGTTFEYSLGTAVLGRIIELVCGADLQTVLTDRITRPLGMTDTGFYLPAGTTERAAQAVAQPGTAQPAPPFDPARRPRWFRGDGGMVSTALDYAVFAQMLLGGGQFGSTRLVARSTVRLMTANHLPADVRNEQSVLERAGDLMPVPEYGYGFGLGFAVRSAEGRSPLPGNIGDYFWSGATGPSFWVDPQEDLYAIVMMRAPAQMQPFRRQLRQLVYAAIE